MGGVVLECVADPAVPGVAVLFGLVLASAEWCDGFGDGSGDRAGSDRMVESSVPVGVDKRADLL